MDASGEQAFATGSYLLVNIFRFGPKLFNGEPLCPYEIQLGLLQGWFFCTMIISAMMRKWYNTFLGHRVLFNFALALGVMNVLESIEWMFYLIYFDQEAIIPLWRVETQIILLIVTTVTSLIIDF